MTSIKLSRQSCTCFQDLGLTKPIMAAITESAYTTPTPIQVQIIPYMLQGRDVIAEAQTGTGKTAAFALPLLSQINFKQKKPQVLVLIPTRELAIQISEAFKRYALKMTGLSVFPIYGGQEYSAQFRALERGVHVVVGTPGRIIDHMKKGTLDLSQLNCLVLDEADEMLRMGFIEDLEWILEKVPNHCQTALFSATMPREIKQMAGKYLNNPEKVAIQSRTTTGTNITQRYFTVLGRLKFDALTKILEVEKTEGVIVFMRTKNATIEVVEKLEAHGYAAAALNGDLPQAQRERTIEQLKLGKLDILVATDVAARGLDVKRINHVINYDMPHDVGAYVHRIGRTGRAGRRGDAILFVTPAEQSKLYRIESSTKQKINEFKMPEIEEINKIRIDRFKQNITNTISDENIVFFKKILEEYRNDANHDFSDLDIAAALAKIAQGETPLLLQKSYLIKQEFSRKKRPNQKFNFEGNKGLGQRGQKGQKNTWTKDRKPRVRSKKRYSNDKIASKNY